MFFTEQWMKFLQWMTSLSAQKLLLVAGVSMLSYLLYENNQLKQENGKINRSLTISYSRCDSIVSILNSRIQQCNDERTREMQESNTYWKQKFENLEERLYKEHQRINRIK